MPSHSSPPYPPDFRPLPRRISILGATGSVGRAALEVIALHPERYQVFSLVANENVQVLLELCLRFLPRYAAMACPVSAKKLAEGLSGRVSTEVLYGTDAVCRLASHPEVDDVVAAIAGSAGLLSSLEAAKAGKRILLANKEALVMSGEVFLAACRASGGQVLPIDSEHNAVFQCLPKETVSDGGSSRPSVEGVRRVLLTASGGPFLRMSMADMRHVRPEQACAHPNWPMGRKISVDSATMMNKGLELIEAHYLFNLSPDHLAVVVHPQSIVHSVVEFLDGSLLAQMSATDMRIPIAFALSYPDRVASGACSLDLLQLGRLDFEPPDFARFPCLGLAQEALRIGGWLPCVLNAANEVAVSAFLSGTLMFSDIFRINATVLEVMGVGPAGQSASEILQIDASARSLAGQHCLRWAA